MHLDTSALLAIDWLMALIAAWLLIGLTGMLGQRNLAWVGKTLYPLGALVGLAVAGVAFTALGEPAETAVLPLGLPDLPFHLRLDALSALFLLLLGGTAAGISIYASGYLRKGEGTAPGLQSLQYHIFLASMALVLLADDAYAFMVAWESMALSSFFLVTSDHRKPEIRRAGYLYLLIAHIGAIIILLSFGVLQSSAVMGATNGVADYTFSHMRATGHDAFWARVAFGLALFG
ncbi:MAG: hydrogenase 4 subunit B, partial [Proteobacteria bacterium]|nr:hydrogenase 4 subunit B [Pseudomonadota bacterium]